MYGILNMLGRRYGVLFFIEKNPNTSPQFGKVYMETRQNRKEIGFLRIDGNFCGCYNELVNLRTLMTDGSVEHHME